MAEKVILLDYWSSPYCARVRIALAEKGIEHECIEDLHPEKSELLLKSNPIHKKIPVLIHNGIPICESLIIVQYIDAMWKNKSPLLPHDPYQRANAMFWADFIDKKVVDCIMRIWKTKGEAREAAKEELIECLKLVEGELGGKAYLGGENFGLADIALIAFSCCFYMCETIGNFSIEKECPKLMEWVKKCMEREAVSKALPDPLKFYEFLLELKKIRGIE